MWELRDTLHILENSMSSASLKPLGKSLTPAQIILDRFLQDGILKPSATPNATKMLPFDPDKQRKEIYDTAKANQGYYLHQAATTGKPWLHCVRQATQYSEFVLVTPEMAKKVLEFNQRTGRFRNRKLTQKDVKVYADDIKFDRWIPTAESISIDTAGMLENGQHRCEAIMLAETPAIMYVTFNVFVLSRFVIDSGRKRSVNDKLNLVVEAPLGPRGAAVCRSMMRGMGAKAQFSETEISEFALKHEKILHWVSAALPAKATVRSDMQAAVAKAALWFGTEKLEDFCKRYRTMVFKDELDPAAVLYRYLIRAKGESGITIYQKTLGAIDNELKGKSVRCIFEAEEDVFDWVKGWEVPKPALA